MNGATKEPPPSKQRGEMVAVAVTIFVCVALVVGVRFSRAIMPRASEPQCKSLLERYFDHQAYLRYRGVAAVDLREARRKARANPLYFEDVRRCRAQLSAAQVECGIASPTMNALEQCLQ